MDGSNGSSRGSRGSLDKSHEADSGSDSNVAICNNRAVSPSNGASLNSAQNPEHSLDMITTDVTGRSIHIVDIRIQAPTIQTIENDLKKLAINKDTTFIIHSTTADIQKVNLYKTLDCLLGRHSSKITKICINDGDISLKAQISSVLPEMQDIAKQIKDNSLEISDIFKFPEYSPTPSKQQIYRATASTTQNSETLDEKLEDLYIQIKTLFKFSEDAFIDDLPKITKRMYNYVENIDQLTKKQSVLLWNNLEYIVPYVNSFEDEYKKLSYKLIYSMSNIYPEKIAIRIQNIIELIKKLQSPRKNFFDFKLNNDNDIAKLYYLPILAELVKNKVACNYILDTAINKISEYITVDKNISIFKTLFYDTDISDTRALFFADYMADIIQNAHDTKKQSIINQLLGSHNISKKFKRYLSMKLKDRKIPVNNNFSLSLSKQSKVNNYFQNTKNLTNKVSLLKNKIHTDIKTTLKSNHVIIEQQSLEENTIENTEKLNKLEVNLNSIKYFSTLTEANKTKITKETLEIIKNLSTYNNTQESNRAYKLINKVVSLNDTNINEQIYKSLHAEYSKNSKLLKFQINQDGTISNNNYLPLLKNLTLMTNHNLLLIQSLPHIIPKNDKKNSIFISQYIATTINSLESNDKKLEALDTALSQTSTNDFKKQLLFNFLDNSVIIDRLREGMNIESIESVNEDSIRDAIFQTININHTNSLYNQDGVSIPFNILDTNTTELSEENLASLRQLPNYEVKNINLFNISLMLNNIIDKSLRLDSIHTYYYAYCFSEILKKIADKPESNTKQNIELIKSKLFENRKISTDFKKTLQVILISKNIELKPKIELITNTEANTMVEQIRNFNNIVRNKVSDIEIINTDIFTEMLNFNSDEINLIKYVEKTQIQEDSLPY